MSRTTYIAQSYEKAALTAHRLVSIKEVKLYVTTDIEFEGHDPKRFPSQ